MYDVIDIAKKLLKKGVESVDFGGEYMTESKLQKMLYMLQKYYVAALEKPLFNEPIIATEHGPVCQKVRDCFGENGYYGIIFDGEAIDFESENEEAIFNYVWRFHNVYSAIGLLNKIKKDGDYVKAMASDDHIVKFYTLKLID